MGKNTRLSKETNLEKEIKSVLLVMSKLPPDSKEYTAMTSNLERLYNALEREYNAKSKARIMGISPDSMVMLFGNLMGIAMILGYERVNIITSKALGFVTKWRV